LDDFPFDGHYTLTLWIAKRCIDGERSSRTDADMGVAARPNTAVLEAWLRVGRGEAIRTPLTIAASISCPFANNHRFAKVPQGDPLSGGGGGSLTGSPDGVIAGG